MKLDLIFLVLGLGLGGAYAMMTLGVVSIYRASGVPNFAQGAIAMMSAFVYFDLRSGPLGSRWAFVVTIVLAAAVGVLFWAGVLRQLRNAPLLAKISATIALLVLLHGIATVAFSSASSTPEPILPQDRVHVLGYGIPADRFIIVGMAVVLAVVLEIVARRTRFGLATRAIAESEKGVVLIGRSPGFLAAANWALASVLAALAGIFISPSAGLNADVLTLLIIPVLAAALVARFTSYVWAVAAAIAIGCVQSVLQLHSAPGPAWTFLWEGPGRANAFPALLVFVIMLVSGKVIPRRDEITAGRLPTSPEPRMLWAGLPVLAVAGTVLLLTLPLNWVAAATVSVTATIVGASLVLLTGVGGQISLVQLGSAGLGAFVAAQCADHGVPFVPGVVLGVLAGALFGLVVGMPSLRIRGQALAIMTLAASVALYDLVLSNGQVYPASGFLRISGFPAIGSWNLTQRSFGVVCLALLVASLAVTALLRRSRFGLRSLLMRESERSAIITGISVTRQKIVLFVVASAMAALGGALIVHAQLAFSDASYTVLGSLLLFCVAYIAGLGMISGAVIAGIGATGGLFSNLLAQINATTYSEVIAGGLLLLLIQLHPDGIATVPELIRERRRDRLARRSRQGGAAAPAARAPSGVPAPVAVDAAEGRRG